MIAKKVGTTLTEEVIPKAEACSKETKAKYPKLPALVLGGDHVIFGTSVIARHLARKNPLYAIDNEASMAMIDSWMELIHSEIADKLYSEAIMPILGRKSYTNKCFNDAVTAFRAFVPAHMKNLGEHLVGTTLTIADIYTAGFLFMPFALLIDEGQRKAFPKFAEWFKHVTADPDFAAIFGIPRYCKTSMKPVLPAEECDKKAEKEKEKTEKKDKKDKKEKEKAKKPEAEAEEAGDDEPKKKPPNPLDLLKPSSMNLDDMKREFLANKTAETRRAYIRDTFWKKFDAEGWALWFTDYVKGEGEGQVLYKTANLMAGFLWVHITISSRSL